MSSLNETVTAVQAVDVPSGLVVPEGLSSLIAGVASNGLVGVGLFILLLIAGVAFHVWNMDRTYRRIRDTSKNEKRHESDLSSTNIVGVSKGDLRKEMFTRHGSNFNAASATAWMLLFVAFAYFYFLTPEIFPQHNYYQFSTLPSHPLGFFAFGFVFIIFLGLPAAFIIPKEFYGYYELSREMKIAIMLTVPLLVISIFLSVQQGTIFPEVDQGSMIVAFLALFASQLALLWPVFAEILGGIR